MKNSPTYGALKTDALFREVKKIKNDTLRYIGNAFEYNVTIVAAMISLPEIVCSLVSAEMNGYRAGVKAGLKSTLTSGNVLSQKAVEELAHKYWEDNAEDIVKKATADGRERFSKLAKAPFIYESYRPILYAGIVFIWCSFEVCMRDLWEASLNAGKKALIKTILGNISNTDTATNFRGIQGKYVSLESLGKYNYDVSKKVGSLLINKFDFSSVNGIREAYRCAFPRSITIKNALENKDLADLEVRRHVIVHNAGVIDEEYCKRTRTNKAQIGTKLEIGAEGLVYFGNLVIDTVVQLIGAVSTYVQVGKSMEQ